MKYSQKSLLISIGGVASAAVLGGGLAFAGPSGLLLSGAVIALGVVIWKPEVAFFVSLLSMIVGQLIRLPLFGGDNAVIINDLLLPLLIVVWALRRLLSGTWTLPRHSLTLPTLAVIGCMALSLLTNSSTYSSTEVLSGALYQVRWIEYAAVLAMGVDFFRVPTRAWAYLKILVVAGVVVSLLGFVQLQVFPDFTSMVPQGWDPHVGRLLSTWFDPNFLAGWLSFMVTITTAVALSQPWRQAKWWWIASVVMTTAIILTFSRSGYVALVAGVGIVTLFRSRALLFIGLIGMVMTIMFVPRVQERVIGIRTVDETAQLRIVSWKNAFEVISDYPWFGVGYNVYKYVQIDYGFLDTTNEHSASGSDSSLLSIWVTTGTIGLLAYLWLLVALLREAWVTWHSTHVSKAWRSVGLGVFAGLGGLMLHAQFVNSLLYPHIMQTVWLCLAMLIMVRQPHART